jgi:hypothetical protein
MVSEEGKNLVFLFSLPRSGSTLLSLLLGNHSKVVCPPEPWFLLKISALFNKVNSNCPFDDKLATIGLKEFLSRESFFEAARAFALTAYNKQLNQSQKTILVDKTPRYYHILDFIERLFPKAKKIWLKRNPLDVVLSYKREWNIDLQEILGKKVTYFSFDFALGLFEFEKYFNSPSPFKFELNYESLVKKPMETLAGLCQFLGIENEMDMLNFFQNKDLISKNSSSVMGDKKALVAPTVHSNSVGGWYKGFIPQEVGDIVHLLGLDIFKRMGFPDVVDSLKEMGVGVPSEEEAAEARQKICNFHLDRMKELTRQLEESEFDRGERLKQINELTQLLKESEFDRGERVKEINGLTLLLQKSEAEQGVFFEKNAILKNELKKLTAEKKVLREKLDQSPPSWRYLRENVFYKIIRKLGFWGKA